MLRSLANCLLLWAAGAACAQPGPAPAAPKRDPLNAAEVVPPVSHRSATAGYRRHGEQPLASWREANDTVTQIGGWRAYAREANAPAAADVTTTNPPPTGAKQ